MIRSNFAPDLPPLESDFERRFNAYVMKRGWMQMKFTSPGKRHVQDRILIRNGVVIFCELKREGEPERPAQRVRRQQMEAHGAKCYVFDTIEEAMRVLH